MGIDEIIKTECDNDPAFVDCTNGFKGTKDEWALYYMETHMIPSAKDYDNVAEEMAMKRVLKLAKDNLSV